MAFYDMYPMGSGYGGMNVGGMPIGGVFPKQGDPLYAAFRQKVTAGRQAKSTWVQNKRAELAANGVSKKRAVQLSNQMWEAHKASLPGAKKHKTLADMTPDELATHKAKIVENRMARQQPGYVRVPHPTNKFENVRRRISARAVGRNPDLETYGRPMGVAELEALADFLTQEGYGIHDLHSGEILGEGFFDDLWSGVKDVGKTALHLAPHLLPMML